MRKKEIPSLVQICRTTRWEDAEYTLTNPEWEKKSSSICQQNIFLIAPLNRLSTQVWADCSVNMNSGSYVDLRRRTDLELGHIGVERKLQ